MSIESRSRECGTVFEHWQIGKTLDSGRKSAVFLLQRTDAREGECVLKVINLVQAQGNRNEISQFAMEDYLRSMKKIRLNAVNEVNLVGKLRGSRNIVDYLDYKFVDWEEEDCFGCDLLIRMERLNGLRNRIQQKINQGQSFSEAEIRRIGSDICRALMRCEKQNILHRDIKPENILADESGTYKLGDFGIARMLSVSSSNMAGTGTGAMEYAAPEQLQGQFDQRVDIYSLGLVLYELSNRCRLPFAESIYVRQEDVFRRYFGEPLPAPCEVSEALAEVILKACAFRPEDRYQTAEEFYDALQYQNPVTRTAPQGKAGERFETLSLFPEYKKDGDREGTGSQGGSGSESGGGQKRPSWLELVLKKINLMLVAAVAVAGLVGVGVYGYMHCWFGHALLDADCESASICVRCSARIGEPREHVLEQHAGKAPSCTEAGWEAYETCANCSYTTYKEIPIREHSWQRATVDRPQTCSVCGTTLGEPLTKCKSCGYETQASEGRFCPNCGKSFDITICGSCGYETDITGGKFCPECGNAY